MLGDFKAECEVEVSVHVDWLIQVVLEKGGLGYLSLLAGNPGSIYAENLCDVSLVEGGQPQTRAATDIDNTPRLE